MSVTSDDVNKSSTSTSPVSESSLHESAGFLLPSPLPTKRNRTNSQCAKAVANPLCTGRIKSFCRQKGHGFIVSEDVEDPIFVHISDIEGELVPLEGDEVSYKRCPIPPNNEKFSATHVVITHAKEGSKHERWDGQANLDVI